MGYTAKFNYPKEYRMILRDSFREDKYYGLDEFDCKYLKIVQAKFGCLNCFHTIPERVKMEMAPFEWNDKKQEFILTENKRLAVQLNQLETMIVSYSFA
jgi:hypothetical protein